MKQMQVTIDIPEELVPKVLWEALENLAASIRRLRRLKKLLKHQREDLADHLQYFDALSRTWQYYSVPSEWPQVDLIPLEDEDI